MKNMNEQIKISRLTNTNTLVIAFFCLIFGLISFIIRFYLNFSQELIPGVNGGYYPLQVRTLLAFGYLGFSDMPLLFYLNAMIIKIISLFGFAILML
jgi:hypothetical protein